MQQHNFAWNNIPEMYASTFCAQTGIADTNFLIFPPKKRIQFQLYTHLQCLHLTQFVNNLSIICQILNNSQLYSNFSHNARSSIAPRYPVINKKFTNRNFAILTARIHEFVGEFISWGLGTANFRIRENEERTWLSIFATQYRKYSWTAATVIK